MFYKDCNKNYKPTENSLLIDKYVQNCVVYTLNSENYQFTNTYLLFDNLVEKSPYVPIHVQIACLLRVEQYIKILYSVVNV